MTAPQSATLKSRPLTLPSVAGIHLSQRPEAAGGNNQEDVERKERLLWSLRTVFAEEIAKLSDHDVISAGRICAFMRSYEPQLAQICGADIMAVSTRSSSARTAERDSAPIRTELVVIKLLNGQHVQFRPDEVRDTRQPELTPAQIERLDRLVARVKASRPMFA